jgi:putative NADH-flavin reductase
LLKAAQAEGYSVTALARDPQALSDVGPGVVVVPGDAFDESSVRHCVSGQNAVLIALGAKRGTGSTVCSDGTQNIVNAMTQSGVSRVICISARGVGDSADGAGFVFSKIIRPLLLKNEYADKEKQETILTASPLEWTIVRPGRLADGSPSKAIRESVHMSGSPTAQIPRASVAQFVVGELEHPRYMRQAVTIVT